MKKAALQFVLLVVCANASAGVASADVIPKTLLYATLASTAQVQQKNPPVASNGMRFYTVKGTEANGFVSTDSNDYGFLKNGEDLLVVPLVSGGSGGVFTTLLFTSIHQHPKFIGIIPSPNGHLEVSITEGLIDVRTPNYDNGAPNCCPSSRTDTIYELDGTKLKKLRADTIKIAQ